MQPQGRDRADRPAAPVAGGEALRGPVSGDRLPGVAPVAARRRTAERARIAALTPASAAMAIGPARAKGGAGGGRLSSGATEGLVRRVA
jgi:hypothetical protein